MRSFKTQIKVYNVYHCQRASYELTCVFVLRYDIAIVICQDKLLLWSATERTEFRWNIVVEAS